MNTVQETEKKWMDAQNVAKKARLEYLESRDRWERLNQEQETLFDRHIDALRFQKTIDNLKNIE